jgi:hypothetical protein
MFADFVHMQQLWVGSPGPSAADVAHGWTTSYTDSDGKEYKGDNKGFDIDMGGKMLHIDTSKNYGESTFKCMDHNCMLE